MSGELRRNKGGRNRERGRIVEAGGEGGFGAGGRVRVMVLE